MKAIFLFAILSIQSVLAEVTFTPDLNLDLEFHYYDRKPNEKAIGQKHRSKIGLETKLSENTNFYNSINLLYFSTFSNQEKRLNFNDKEIEIFLGENYLNHNFNNSQIRLGYQIVSWGESFAFNYADIINPKDQRETFYFDYSNSRLPSFMLNYKYFLTNGSIEVIYSPEVRYSKTLPLNLVLKNEIPGINLKTNIDEKEDFFDESDYGLKVSKTIYNADIALFYYNYMDKNPHYSLYSINTDGLTLEEKHNRIASTGLSFAKTLNDEYVLRADLVHHNNKIVNSYKLYNLEEIKTSINEFTLSLDTPTYNNFSGLLLFAQSSLKKDLPDALRAKHLQYGLVRVTYDFKEDRKLDFSYTHEFNQTAHAIMSVYNFPYSDTLEMRIGAEYYWGDNNSQLNRLRDFSSVFVGLKKYFNL